MRPTWQRWNMALSQGAIGRRASIGTERDSTGCGGSRAPALAATDPADLR